MRLQLEATAKSKQLTEVRIYPVTTISCFFYRELSLVVLNEDL
jgi:hypothetical protein